VGELLANFDEVRSHLVDTRCEWMLESRPLDMAPGVPFRA
jgi:hypothetical protein